MRYAVSHIDWYDHDLTTVIVEAATVVEAMKAHPKAKDIVWEGSTEAELKQDCFDCDCMIHAEPIP